MTTQRTQQSPRSPVPDSEWETVEALCAPAADSSASDWVTTLEAFTNANTDAIEFIDGKRVLTAGALGEVNVCGSDLSDWYVKTTAADGTEQIERMSDVILHGDHAEIARVVGQAIFDENTRFGFGEDNAKCHAILQGISNSVAQDAGDYQLQNLPALSMPLLVPPAPGAGPTTDTAETGALGALQRFHTTPEAIQAISIAKMLEKGPVTHLPSIGRPEPTTNTEWEQKRGVFCAALVQEFPSRQMCVDGGWVEPVVTALEELARLPKETQSADASEHVNQARRLIAYLKDRNIAGLSGNQNKWEDEGDEAVRVLKAIGYWGADANVTYLRARPCADFSQEVMEEVAQIREARKEGIQRREGVVDLTALPTFTIDPEGSQDHDDAVSVEALDPEQSNGATHRIHLHVTNVAEAIDSFQDLMQEAYRRGSTIYRPNGKHIPMLPTELSHNLLSLNEGKEREAVTISFDIKGDGSLVGEPQLKRSIINVNKNLTFEEADRVLAQEAGAEEDAEMKTALQAAQRFAGSFRQSLEPAGAKRINFDSSIITNDDGSWKIKITPQGAARAMIESLSHAYSCTAAAVFEQRNERQEMQALFRGATLKDEPHARKNRERFEELARKSEPSEKDIAQMRVLQMGLMNRASLELSSAAVPHEGIGKPSMASSSPLRDGTNLYNQRVLLALIDPRVEPPLADSTVKRLTATSATNKNIQGEDTNRALYEMIGRQKTFEAYAVSDYAPNQKKPSEPLEQIKLFVPELNKWYRVPQNLRQRAQRASQTDVPVTITLAVAGNGIEVTAIQ